MDTNPDIASTSGQECLLLAKDKLAAFSSLASAAVSSCDQSDIQHEQFRKLSVATSSSLRVLVALTNALATDNPKRGVFATAPPSVLAEILRAWQANDLSSIDSPPTFPFVAAAVNKHWRSVALSTSCIWTRVVFDFARAKRRHEYFKLVLHRSKTCPINLRILGAPPSAYDETVPSELLLQLLTSASHIDIHFRYAGLHDMHFDDSILALFQADFPFLESIEIHTSRAHGAFPSGTRLLTSAPRLCYLGAGNLPLAAFDMDSLRSLTAFSSERGLSDEDYAAISSKWSGLTSLTLLPSRDHSERKSLVLPALTSLRCSRGAVITSFQSAEHFSCLRALDILYTSNILDALSALLQSSPCVSLQELTLRESFGNGPLPQTCLLALTKTVPNIQLIRLHGFLFSKTVSEFFEAWQQESTTTLTLLPHIATLVFERCTIDVSVANSVLRFLQRIRERRRSVGVAILSRSGTQSQFPLWLETRLRQLVGRLTIGTSRLDELKCTSELISGGASLTPCTIPRV
ncbi:hypothetical protein EXIGLDRAFT_773869 [Exidia glandulosa HHB12029]|uniref:F-box domain-containing protein n=1 Tax=Exidia glandulosa HHB12029 TaxID=1314781 RepID=A0A165ELF1_EXIGL|nr:hypothetical protein EXIGLDRAFT_773869 [Exidia glandulosa HHB12029]